YSEVRALSIEDNAGTSRDERPRATAASYMGLVARYDLLQETESARPLRSPVAPATRVPSSAPQPTPHTYDQEVTIGASSIGVRSNWLDRHVSTSSPLPGARRSRPREGARQQYAPEQPPAAPVSGACRPTSSGWT